MACTGRAICRWKPCWNRSASSLPPISPRTVRRGKRPLAGPLSAGDVLIAIDGLRVTGSNLDSLLSRYLPGAKVEVHAFRRDELRVTQVKLDAPDVSRYVLSTADSNAQTKQWRERW